MLLWLAREVNVRDCKIDTINTTGLTIFEGKGLLFDTGLSFFEITASWESTLSKGDVS